MDSKINLEEIRKKLRRLEDSIILFLFERSQYKVNEAIYTPGAVEIPNFKGSFFEYLFIGTEELHASAGRYIDPEEHAFFIDPPKPLVSRRLDNIGIQTKVNLNDKILDTYLRNIKLICEDGDDNKYGSSAVSDINCLQEISKRVHIGEQVAEAKFQEDPNEYSRYINSRDREGIVKKLRDVKIEDENLERIKMKGERYNINTKFIYDFYKNEVMPLTIEVEVKYFMSKKYRIS